jgi:hypothetical protein
MKTATLTAFLLMACTTVSAQWPSRPTPGIPKKADGSPDLNAPTPRAADGKPDLSGLWELEKNRPCPPEGCNDMEISQEFVNLGWNMKDGLPFQPWAAALVKQRRADFGKDDPGSLCQPTGIVKLVINPFFRKFIQLPGLLIVLNERDVNYRQIFMDGRSLPKDAFPTSYGYSTAKWDGDTLVVETSGFPDGQWLDRAGSPLTESGKITERYRRVNYGTMEIEITVDDPKAYTRPWTAKVKQFIRLDSELIDYFCMQNEKDTPHLVGNSKAGK